MAIFFAATGSILARPAQRTEWNAVRKAASLIPKVGVASHSASDTSPSDGGDDFNTHRGLNRFDISEPRELNI